MSSYSIRKPIPSDLKEIHTLFQTVITHTFAKEGISHLKVDQQQELLIKKQYLDSAFTDQKTKRHFLVAMDQSSGRVIGTIEHGQANETIQYVLKENVQNYPEVGTVFVLPELQGTGIGTTLFQAMLSMIKDLGYYGYCLDSGYKQSQQFWIRRLGPPTFIQTNHWDQDSHHMVWKRRFEG